MKDRSVDFKVDIMGYDLPLMFGFWMSDPEELRWREKITGEVWRPRAWLFLGDHHVIQLDLIEEDGEVVTRAIFHVYAIDNTEIIMRSFAQDQDGNSRTTDRVTFAWALTKDGKFNLRVDDYWWRYVSAGTNDLVAGGFDRELVEGLIEKFRMEGIEALGSFNEAKARELIAEKIRREDEEHGF